MNFLKKSFSGLSWMGLFRISFRLIGFLKIAILARILSPAQFGLFGVASLALSFLEVITETGINVFFIQKEGKIKEYISTAWVVSIIRGLAIGLILFAMSGLIAGFFRQPDSRGLLILISIVPILRGFINPAIVTFKKELQFKREFYLRFLILLLDSFVAILVTILTKSPLGLVWGLVSGVILEIILSFSWIEIKPKLKIEKIKIKKVVSRGKWVTLAGFFEYLFKEVDDILVGRILNTYSLGIYQMGYKISSLPLTEITEVVRSVSFPVLSKKNQGSKEQKRLFIESFLLTGTVVVILAALIYFFSEFFVYLLLGEKWFEVIPVVKALALFGVARSLTTISYPLFFAVKKQEYVTFVTLFGLSGLALTIYPFILKYQVIGAAYSAFAGALVALPVSIYLAIKVLYAKN